MTDVYSSTTAIAGPTNRDKFVDIDNRLLKFSYYAAAKDKTITCKKGIIHVITKKNKGTVVGVWSNEDLAKEEREKLGGERYYRISRFIVDKSVYYDFK